MSATFPIVTARDRTSPSRRDDRRNLPFFSMGDRPVLTLAPSDPSMYAGSMDSKLEDLLNSLEVLAGQHSNEPEAVATIENAAKALHFLQHVGRLKDFWEYARVFNTEEARPKPLRSFSTRDEALAWLRAQATLPYETVIAVAGALHNVTRMRDGEWIFIRFPSREELEAMEESEE